MNIKRFRRIQTTASIILFIGVFFLCWYVTKFNIKEIQLSYWGVESGLGWIWNSCIMLLAVSIFMNIYYFITQHTRLHDRYTPLLKTSFILISLLLFITGAVDMTHWLHQITARVYFFTYPMAIFLFAHLNRKYLQYREWRIHTSFAVCMVAFPLLAINFFPGMAIAEMVHSTFVIGWNIWLLTLD